MLHLKRTVSVQWICQWHDNFSLVERTRKLPVGADASLLLCLFIYLFCLNLFSFDFLTFLIFGLFIFINNFLLLFKARCLVSALETDREKKKTLNHFVELCRAKESISLEPTDWERKKEFQTIWMWYSFPSNVSTAQATVLAQYSVWATQEKISNFISLLEEKIFSIQPRNRLYGIIFLSCL